MSYQVSGKKILHNGKEIQLFGVNWFGFEQPSYAFHGLWSVNLEKTLDSIKSKKFNALRIPYRPSLLKNPPTSSINFNENPSLNGMHGLDLLDLVTKKLEERGMRYILDHHHTPDSITDLPFNDQYSEGQWHEDLKFMALRYKSRPGFVGIDLKNEPHGEATWGTGDKRTDWKMAAEGAYRAIASVNSEILVFVEGIQKHEGSEDAWWGGSIAGQINHPLDIPADKLVFAPHVYGPSVYAQKFFDAPNFPENLPALWERDFGVVENKGFALCPTEFGGTYEGKDKVWQDRIIAWFKAQGMTNFFYWCFNENSGDTKGLILGDWKTWDEAKLGAVQRLWTPMASFLGEAPKPTPAPTPSPTPSPAKHAFKVGDLVYAQADHGIKLKVEGLQTHADGKYVRVSGVIKQSLLEK